MRFRPPYLGLCALALFACDDSATETNAGRPSLRVGGGGECGVTLPIPSRDQFTEGTYRTAAVTVAGTDPGASNMEIRNGTEVTIIQTSNNPDAPQVVAFVSAFDLARQQTNILEAVQQATESKGVSFVGGGAVDRVFCVSGGTATIEASIPSYAGGGGFVGAVTTPQAQRFQIRCVSADIYEQQCGNTPPPDAEVLDAGPSDMGVPVDAGDVGDGGTPPPSLWSVKYVPPADAENLRIGIRNSGLGRRDNTELSFVVAELERPLPDVLVKFILDDITQPGVSISGGNASLFEADNEVVVRTTGDGTVRVRLIAGGSPGLAAVRAVALRYDASDLRGCAATDYNCLFQAYCGRGLSRIDQASECEQDRSQVVTIEAGIPSGRNLHLVCETPILPAFTVRERVRGLDNWGLSNEDGGPCFIQVADRVSGRVKEGTGVFFLTEAGTMDEVGFTDEAGRAQSIMRIGRDAPRDVPAIEYEQMAGFPRNGHNPRDGLVRLVAFTRGEEAFFDANGDNVYNEADGDYQEPGQDLPEPFVDANDNGTWDDNERFQDSNNNGVWDDANGIWDASTDIWTSTAVLWVGDLFSCNDDTGAASSSPDCNDAELIPDGRKFPVVAFECGEGCSTNQALNPLCPPAPFYLDPGQGGSIELTAAFFDINGNCLNGRGQGKYEVRTGADLVAIGPPSLGPLRCFASFERPLSPLLAPTLVDTLPANPMGFTVTPVEIQVSYERIGGGQVQVTYRTAVCR